MNASLRGQPLQYNPTAAADAIVEVKNLLKTKGYKEPERPALEKRAY